MAQKLYSVFVASHSYIPYEYPRANSQWRSSWSFSMDAEWCFFLKKNDVSSSKNILCPFFVLIFYLLLRYVFFSLYSDWFVSSLVRLVTLVLGFGDIHYRSALVFQWVSKMICCPLAKLQSFGSFFSCTIRTKRDCIENTSYVGVALMSIRFS